MSDLVKRTIEDSTEVIASLLEQSQTLINVSNLIYDRLTQGNKILVFGNGGSAADAQHIAAEFMGKYQKDRKGLRAIALSTDTSFLTAYSNDYNFVNVFGRQVETLAKPLDVLWGISTSGTSPNVIEAFKRGRVIGTYNFSFTGRKGGELKGLSDANINIDFDNTARVQEAHRVAYHIICELVENKLVRIIKS